MGFLSLLSVRAWASLGLALALTALVGWGYFHIRGSGVAACESRHKLADAAAEASAHKEYLAALGWGNQLSADLAETQRKLNATKTEYLLYANGISGNCPSTLGVLTNAAATGAPVPQPTGEPADPPAALSTIEASLIAANIAENYGRANACITQFNALIDWHKHTEAVSP